VVLHLRRDRGWRGFVKGSHPVTIGHIGDATVQTAPCPSLEQLMGITDLNDPCQAANAGLTPPGDVVGQETVGTGISMALLIPIGILAVFAIMGARR
jgi:hypothetical protein